MKADAVMTTLLIQLAVAAASPLPAKLVITTANGVTVTDYPSLARCEVARAALITAWLKDAESRVPSGYKMTQPPPVSAVCIPG